MTSAPGIPQRPDPSFPPIHIHQETRWTTC